MAGRGYSIFDTGIGRCGIAWGPLGIVGVQLPEAREIETRRRLFLLYPDAREQRPPENVEIAIEGIVALLRGEAADLSDVTLDMTDIPGFNQRVYAVTRTIPRGETCTYNEIASGLRASGAVYSVAQAIGRNPFMIIVPLPSRAGSRQLHRQDFTERRRHFQATAALDRGRPNDIQQDAVRRVAAGCTAAPAYLNFCDEPNDAAAAQTYFRVRLPLHGGAGRQAVHGTIRLPFDLLCPQG
jgi:methylated-DNA-[protein]-cysteine S-methyltransferase